MADISLVMYSAALMVVVQLIHILHSFMINKNLQKQKSRGVKSGEWGGREWVPLYLSNDKETMCLTKHKNWGCSH